MWRVVVTVLILCVAESVRTSEPVHTDFSTHALASRMPVVREHSYVVNARVRPLLAFWIGRDNIGDARLTWREAPGGRRGFELLIGSDPSRAPRRINRWGFIVEELHPEKADVLGVMKESNEETIEAAEAQIARERGVTAFKAVRTTITGSRAVSGALTLQAPAHLTYRDLDALLALIPSVPRERTLELPFGTQGGFLVSMDSLLHASVGPCRNRHGAGARDVSAVPFIYGHTLYDLTLTSCTYEPAFRTKTDAFADVVEGRFQVRNRTTKSVTKFLVSYGTSAELRGLPVRAVFRPSWWMEIELLLDRSGNAP